MYYGIFEQKYLFKYTIVQVFYDGNIWIYSFGRNFKARTNFWCSKFFRAVRTYASMKLSYFTFDSSMLRKKRLQFLLRSMENVWLIRNLTCASLDTSKTNVFTSLQKIRILLGRKKSPGPRKTSQGFWLQKMSKK